MNFKQRFKRLSDALHRCAKEVEQLVGIAESVKERQIYTEAVVHLRALAACNDPERIPDDLDRGLWPAEPAISKIQLRKEYLRIVLGDARISERELLVLASKKRAEERAREQETNEQEAKEQAKPQAKQQTKEQPRDPSQKTKKGRIDPRAFENLWNPTPGHTLEAAWRNACRQVLVERLSSSYDSVLRFIFFPEDFDEPIDV
jgi:hypothetical protein